MEYRLLGGSGLNVSALCFGAATFGGGNKKGAEIPHGKSPR
jgi:aryl-alcohol dehydrogenase-like predicted oxidoreductase